MNFLNTSGGARSYRLVILLFRSNGKGFGESTAADVTIPVGASQATTSFITVTGPGDCVALYAQAANKNSPTNKDIFPNTNGQPASVSFTVCS